MSIEASRGKEGKPLIIEHYSCNTSTYGYEARSFPLLRGNAPHAKSKASNGKFKSRLDFKPKPAYGFAQELGVKGVFGTSVSSFWNSEAADSIADWLAATLSKDSTSIRMRVATLASSAHQVSNFRVHNFCL